jgi:hypothetical protein
LRPYAPRAVVAGAGVACLGALDLYLGRLAAAAGDRRGAARHLQAALAMHTRMGARPWIGWTHYELARLAGVEASGRARRAARTGARPASGTGRRVASGIGARAVSGADAPAPARDHLRAARALAEELGMARLAARVDALETGGR